ADYFLKYMTEGERARLPSNLMKPVDGLSGDEDFPKMAEGLTKRSYKSSDIDLIMGENFLRFFIEMLK
ncbi:unnamed protein product, partial [marine sediment metagenome]